VDLKAKLGTLLLFATTTRDAAGVDGSANCVSKGVKVGTGVSDGAAVSDGVGEFDGDAVLGVALGRAVACRTVACCTAAAVGTAGMRLDNALIADVSDES